MENIKLIGLASDHAGFELKEFIKTVLDKKGIAHKDYGTNSTASVDYPDYAHKLANAILAGEVESGIGVCGTGNGMAITLNRHNGIRAGLCWEEEVAQLVRAHNDANVMVLPGRYISEAEAKLCVIAFLETPFEGGRHQGRIDKMDGKI